MKSSELRIGNYYRWSKFASMGVPGPQQITHGQQIMDYIELKEGIPITKEWLVKMGFENHSPGLYRIKIHADQARYLETMLTSKDFWDFTIIIEHTYKSEDTEIWIRACHHLHQLQNLYFALTGSELELSSIPG